MDLEFWGFNHWPFDRNIVEDQLFTSAAFDEAQARLSFLVDERRSLGTLRGPAGTGKSCLLRSVMKVAKRTARHCLFVDATGIDGRELVWQVAEACDVDCDVDDSSGKLWSGLQSRFYGFSVVRQPVLLLIDHFDSSNLECCEVLRRLICLSDLTATDLTVLLATRDRPTLPLLLEVVDLQVEASDWTRQETAQFIRNAIRRAGEAELIFNEEAIQAVHAKTRGNPSRIVKLCDLSLLAAMSEGVRRVDFGIVDAAARELFNQHVEPVD
jgi:type II secretory pathway predicted ATPase ExeA